MEFVKVYDFSLADFEVDLGFRNLAGGGGVCGVPNTRCPVFALFVFA